MLRTRSAYPDAAALLALLLIALPAAAQHPTDCGTASPAFSPAVANPPPGPHTTVFIPLTFHVVRTSDGREGLPPERICRALEDLDAGFAGADIRFYLAGPIDTIDDDEYYYNIDSQEEIDALRRVRPRGGTVNVYFTKNLSRGQGNFCGISSFSWSPVQGIVMANACSGIWSNATTFPHEVGHYLDLLHTHETARGRECVNGSNCRTAGDQLCDTPADPGLGSHNVDPFCVYTGDERDACNADPYEPDTVNLMSGSRPVCRIGFTPDQSALMYAALAGPRRDLPHDDLPAPFDCNGNDIRDDCDIASGYSQDANNNGIPDECENVPGDVDGDGDVDLDDYFRWPECVTGPTGGPLRHRCRALDLDTDDDVDCLDFSLFQRVFTGRR